MSSFSFVFVCQAGRLEVDALVLAASLRRFVAVEHELVAAVPVPERRWGILRPDVRLALGRLGVRVVEIENPVDPDYPTGNKVACLSIPTDADVRVFLDSDIACLRPFAGGEAFEAPFAAKPADLATPGLDEPTWRHAYGAVGLTPPATRMTATVGGQSMLPYYNAGVVATARDTGLGETWAECCRAIDAEPRVQPKRPWLDQVALPVAVHRLGLEAALLSEADNFPAHLRRIDELAPPVLCHYHEPKNLVRSRHGVGVLRDLVRDHPEIWRLMWSEPAWRSVATRVRPSARGIARELPGGRRAQEVYGRVVETRHRGRMTEAETARSAIVTGLPRSGTSLYSTLLNSIPNAICLNEIGSPDRTFRTFRHVRADVAAGRPVANKFSAAGDLVTDTLPGDVRLDRRPAEVVDDSFVLAQKFTLPYLNRLDELIAAGLAVWVLVRHPLHTIESWRRSPPHFAIAQLRPPSPALVHIPFASDDLDERRVTVWNHYAREIDRRRDRVEIVRYEDLVDDPDAELGRFCARFDLEPPRDLPAVRSRNRDVATDDPALADLVRGRCALELFGYE